MPEVHDPPDRSTVPASTSASVRINPGEASPRKTITWRPSGVAARARGSEGGNCADDRIRVAIENHHLRGIPQTQTDRIPARAGVPTSTALAHSTAGQSAPFLALQRPRSLPTAPAAARFHLAELSSSQASCVLPRTRPPAPRCSKRGLYLPTQLSTPEAMARSRTLSHEPAPGGWTGVRVAGDRSRCAAWRHWRSPAPRPSWRQVRRRAGQTQPGATGNPTAPPPRRKVRSTPTCRQARFPPRCSRWPPEPSEIAPQDQGRRTLGVPRRGYRQRTAPSAGWARRNPAA